VRRRHGADLELADSDRLPHLHFDHALEPALAQEASQPARKNDRQLLAELLERREVEVVVVRVRDEHGVEAPVSARRDRHRAPQVGDAVPEQRIGQQPDAVEVDDDRGVSHVLDSPHGVNARSKGSDPGTRPVETNLGRKRRASGLPPVASAHVPGSDPGLRPYTQSLSPCASGSDSSFLSVLFSI
jgi:hypothetical protein